MFIFTARRRNITFERSLFFKILHVFIIKYTKYLCHDYVSFFNNNYARAPNLFGAFIIFGGTVWRVILRRGRTGRSGKEKPVRVGKNPEISVGHNEFIPPTSEHGDLLRECYWTCLFNQLLPIRLATQLVGRRIRRQSIDKP